MIHSETLLKKVAIVTYMKTRSFRALEKIEFSSSSQPFTPHNNGPRLQPPLQVHPVS